MKSMTQEITAFNFGTQEVRTVVIDNEPWFVGNDVADALGYAKARNAISTHVDSEDKKDAPIQGTLGGTQKTTIINESGMYSLIFGSKKDEAKKFKHWVTSEVLPSIRKTGSYSVTQVQDSYAIQDPVERAKRWIEEQEEKQALEQALEIQAPKVEMAEKLLEAPEANISMADFSKVLANYGIKMGRNTLMKELRISGWLLQNNTPSAKAMEREIFQVYEKVVKTSIGTKVQPVTTITPKGQEFLIKRVTRKSDDVA